MTTPKNPAAVLAYYSLTQARREGYKLYRDTQGGVIIATAIGTKPPYQDVKVAGEVPAGASAIGEER
jgi:hypothetical protein